MVAKENQQPVCAEITFTEIRMKRLPKGIIKGLGILAALLILLEMGSCFYSIGKAGRTNACRIRMQHIARAKETFCLEHDPVPTGTVVTAADITPFLEGNKMPICPSSSKAVYSIGRIGERPSCPIHGPLGDYSAMP
jgi:hypothetical protein